MELSYDREDDILQIRLKDTVETVFGGWGPGMLHVDQEGELAEVEILHASEGVNLDALPDEVREQVRKYLEENVLEKTAVDTPTDDRVPA